MCLAKKVLGLTKEIDYINDIASLDLIGEQLIEVRKGLKVYEDGCNNRNYISESSFSRILSQMENKEFAILTAYRALDKNKNKLSKNDNIKRNRILRGALNSLKLGVHQLVGHWRECDDSSIPYRECPDNRLTDVIERSYLVVKPDNMSSEEFYKIIFGLLKIDGETQDAFILKDSKGIYAVDNNGSRTFLGTKADVGKIGQGYSQYVKKLKQPFVFEGLEVPSSNMGALVMTKKNVKYIDYPII